MEISNPCHGCTKADTVDYSPSQLAVKVTTECTAQVYLSVCTNDFQWIRCSFDVLIWLPFPYYIAHIHCPWSLIKEAHSSCLAVLYFCDNVPSPLFSSFDYFRDVHCIWYDCDVILFGYVRLVEQWNTSLDWLYLNIPGTKLQLVSGLAIQILTGIFITNCELFSYLLTNLLTYMVLYSLLNFQYVHDPLLPLWRILTVQWPCADWRHFQSECHHWSTVHKTTAHKNQSFATVGRTICTWATTSLHHWRVRCRPKDTDAHNIYKKHWIYHHHGDYGMVFSLVCYMLRCFYFILSTATLFCNVQNEHCEQKTNRRDICGYINVIMLLLWYLYRFIQKTCISV